MQLVYDFLYKRHSPTFLIFLYTGHSDYPVDSDYPLKYSIVFVIFGGGRVAQLTGVRSSLVEHVNC